MGFEVTTRSDSPALVTSVSQLDADTKWTDKGNPLNPAMTSSQEVIPHPSKLNDLSMRKREPPDKVASRVCRSIVLLFRCNASNCGKVSDSANIYSLSASISTMCTNLLPGDTSVTEMQFLDVPECKAEAFDCFWLDLVGQWCDPRVAIMVSVWHRRSDGRSYLSTRVRKPGRHATISATASHVSSKFRDRFSCSIPDPTHSAFPNNLPNRPMTLTSQTLPQHLPRLIIASQLAHPLPLQPHLP